MSKLLRTTVSALLLCAIAVHPGLQAADAPAKADTLKVAVYNELAPFSGMVMLGEGNGRFRDQVHIYPTATEALQQIKAGQLDAVLATRSEIESVMRGDPAFPLQDVPFERLPRAGWAIGMTVKKDNVELARRRQAALNEMAADGQLKAVFAKYGVQVVKP